MSRRVVRLGPGSGDQVTLDVAWIMRAGHSNVCLEGCFKKGLAKMYLPLFFVELKI